MSAEIQTEANAVANKPKDKQDPREDEKKEPNLEQKDPIPEQKEQEQEKKPEKEESKNEDVVKKPADVDKEAMVKAEVQKLVETINALKTQIEGLSIALENEKTAKQKAIEEANALKTKVREKLVTELNAYAPNLKTENMSVESLEVALNAVKEAVALKIETNAKENKKIVDTQPVQSGKKSMIEMLWK